MNFKNKKIRLAFYCFGLAATVALLSVVSVFAAQAVNVSSGVTAEFSAFRVVGNVDVGYYLGPASTTATVNAFPGTNNLTWDGSENPSGDGRSQKNFDFSLNFEGFGVGEPAITIRFTFNNTSNASSYDYADTWVVQLAAYPTGTNYTVSGYTNTTGTFTVAPGATVYKELTYTVNTPTSNATLNRTTNFVWYIDAATPSTDLP